MTPFQKIIKGIIDFILIAMMIVSTGVYVVTFLAYYGSIFNLWLPVTLVTLGSVLAADIIALVMIKKHGSQVSLYKVHTTAGCIVTGIAAFLCTLIGVCTDGWGTYIMLVIFFTMVPIVPSTMIAAYFIHRIRSNNSEISRTEVEENE